MLLLERSLKLPSSSYDLTLKNKIKKYIKKTLIIKMQIMVRPHTTQKLKTQSHATKKNPKNQNHAIKKKVNFMHTKIKNQNS